MNDAALLVGKQRGERIVDVAVIAVKQANDLREEGALDLAGGLGSEGFKGRGV